MNGFKGYEKRGLQKKKWIQGDEQAWGLEDGTGTEMAGFTE